MSRRILFLMGVPQAHTLAHTHTVHLHCECLKLRVEHARYTFSRRCGFTILIKSYTRTTSASWSRCGWTESTWRRVVWRLQLQATTTGTQEIHWGASIFNIYLTFQSTLKRPLSAAFMHMRIIYWIFNFSFIVFRVLFCFVFCILFHDASRATIAIINWNGQQRCETLTRALTDARSYSGL